VKSKPVCKLLLFLVMLLQTALLSSQSIKASVDRNKIEIGEQIQLSISIDSLSLQQFSIITWPQLSDTFHHFDVAQKGEIDSTIKNGLAYFRQVIIITSFDSGRWEIPVMVTTFKGVDSDSVITRNTSPITIYVNSADISGIKGYHDVKDIVLTPNSRKGYKPILIIVGSGFLIMLIYVWLIIRKRRKGKLIVGDGVEGLYTIEWALAQLQLLQENQKALKRETKKDYHRLYLICRKYFSQRVNKEVEHFTTSEWGAYLDEMGIDNTLKNVFFKLLHRADDKRFAQKSTDDEFNKVIEEAEEVVKAIEKATA